MKILLVEDDEILVASLTADLASQNYVVEAVTDGKMGWSYAQATQYDLIVLDVNLPGIDGITLCRRLRQADYEGPVLLLTAKGDSTHKIEGLDAGADDYVVKPCPTEELSARIRALLRRPREVTSLILQWGALQLDPSTCQVMFGANEILLSPKEYGLLELFLRNPQRVFSSAALLERLWGFDEMPGEETIRSHIKRLRRKLKSAGADEVIENIYGMGYRLMPAPLVASTGQPSSTDRPTEVSEQSTPAMPQEIVVKTSSPAVDVPDSASDQKVSTDTAQVARAAAIAVLGQFSGVITERLAILATAADALQTGSLSNELQQAAQQAAHKLVGSLGMFGLAEGSRLSQVIETSLQATPVSISGPQLSTWINQLRQDLEMVLKVAEDEPGNSINDVFQSKGVASETSLPKLLVVSSEANLLTDLRSIGQLTFQFMEADSLAQAQQQLSQHHLDVVLLDMAVMIDPNQTQLFLANLVKTYPHLSILVLTSQDTFEARLEIARYCSCTFLSRDTPTPKLIDNILEAYQHRYTPTLHVLVVDDDPIMLRTLEKQLPPWGLQVTTIEDPSQLWAMLPQLKPDLLILDVEMPQVDGIELCRVIRSDRQWGSLPILFLTARRDTETLQQIFQAGADDYIAKPFTEPELVTRILNRLERQRLAQKLAVFDPITGLPTEQQVLRDISRDLAIAQRYRQPYCLALITVGSPELLAALAPSWLGEQFVCNIANIFSERLRQEDLVAQTEPHAFLLGLYGIHKQQAEERLRRLVQELREITLESLQDSSMALPFQIGVAAAPEDGENISMLRCLAEARLTD